jgi:predicted Zn-dependent protease
MKTYLVLSVILSVVFVGCQVNPVTGEKEFNLYSVQQQEKMGAEYSKEVEKELGQSFADKQLQSYLDSVGQRIARVCHTPDEGFSYKAIDSNTVNAFALPGGYIYITTGLLKELNTEAQLAGILAHETAHVTCRHSAVMMSRAVVINAGVSAAGRGVAGSVASIVSQLEGMSYSRANERQADQVGLDYLVKAGYTPYGMTETMEILQRQSQTWTIEFFSTHPNPENRIGYLQERIYTQGYRGEGLIGKTEYRTNVLNRLGK